MNTIITAKTTTSAMPLMIITMDTEVTVGIIATIMEISGKSFLFH